MQGVKMDYLLEAVKGDNMVTYQVIGSYNWEGGHEIVLTTPDIVKAEEKAIAMVTGCRYDGTYPGYDRNGLSAGSCER
jgi:hypothetical protein